MYTGNEPVSKRIFSPTKEPPFEILQKFNQPIISNNIQYQKSTRDESLLRKPSIPIKSIKYRLVPLKFHPFSYTADMANKRRKRQKQIEQFRLDSFDSFLTQEASDLFREVKTPFGIFPTYQAPSYDTFMLEPSSGYYFDESTNYYYDKSSGYFFDSNTSEWLFWSSTYSTYIPCDGGNVEVKKELQLRESGLEEELSSTATINEDIERYSPFNQEFEDSQIGQNASSKKLDSSLDNEGKKVVLEGALKSLVASLTSSVPGINQDALIQEILSSVSNEIPQLSNDSTTILSRTSGASSIENLTSEPEHLSPLVSYANSPASSLQEKESIKGFRSSGSTLTSIASNTIHEPEYRKVPKIGRFKIYPAPVHQLFKFQEDIGLYLDESTGFFYCPKQKHYLDPITQQWMFYSSMYSVYIPSEDGDTEEKLKLEKHEEMYQKVNRMLEEKRRNRESENGESSSPFVPNFNPRLPYYALRFPVHAQRMPLLPQPRQQYPNFDYGVKNPRFFSG